ncbi:MAG: hypothetical protein KDK65_07670 [Chlamydiia bacterium]|nr:hypothetical protein [Chlamydiia bacterium]
MRRLYFVCLWACVFSLQATPIPPAKPLHLSTREWKEVNPYLLPHSHPLHHQLDEIFAPTRFLSSWNTLERLGFHRFGFSNATSQIIVAEHPTLKNYLIKAYTDESPLDGKKLLLSRIRGAKLIAKKIAKSGLNNQFTVPKKWLYRLPHASPRTKQPYLLIVEKMDILPPEAWKQSALITPELLVHLFQLTTKLGLADSCQVLNIPFTADGKIAFIDTEHVCNWPVAYHKLTPFLSPANQLHWQDICSR